MNTNKTDEELQELLRSDNKLALEIIYLKYRDEFIKYSKRYNLDDFTILDVYQDATIAMHQNFVNSNLQLKSSTLKTYLFGIGKNLIFKKLKEENRFLRVMKEEESEYTEIKIEENHPSEKSLILSKNLNLISETCKNILKLYYYRNLTIDEIVEITDYKDGNTVRSHKSRCLKRLKSLFNVNG